MSRAFSPSTSDDAVAQRLPLDGHAGRQAFSAFLWLAVTVAVAAILFGVGLVWGYDVRFDQRSTIEALLIWTGIACLSFLCRNVAPRSAVALASFLLLTIAGAAAGILSMIGQFFAFPLVDSWLAHADRLAGMESVDVVRAIVSIPFGPRVMAAAYVLSTLFLFLSVFALACLGRAERVWELCAVFSFSILIATVLSFIFPAVGAFVHLGIHEIYGTRLPNGSGVYHLEAFYALRGAPGVTINPFKLQGLVTFPSFHTSMALMTMAAWRDDRFLRWPMIVWNSLVVISTVPIGGHYLVDLAGGGLTWWLIFRYGPRWSEVAMRSFFRSPQRPQPA